MLDMVLTTAILLRFLLFPGAFSLLCFSEGKCFITREWNTPLKERYEEEKTETETFILRGLLLLYRELSTPQNYQESLIINVVQIGLIHLVNLVFIYFRTYKHNFF